MTKDELIDYIHILHHNWECTDESYFNVIEHARKLQQELDEESKSAKEMFEELGYKLEYSERGYVRFRKWFNLTYYKKVEFECERKIVFWLSSDNTCYGINLELTKAIQQQMHELGWT